MKNEFIIEDLESSLDNVAHELLNPEYLGAEGYKQVCDAYYAFRDKLQAAIKAQNPNHHFGNF